ncbi:MAG: DeoR/GlpR family DNA-binding transcription regulator [Anaerolineae bacterium]
MKHTHVFQRREKLLQILRQKQQATVEQLAQQMHVSGWTVRRDLAALEEQNQITRFYGGAALALEPAQIPQMEVNAQSQPTAKAAIGKAAARLIKSNQFVALAAGSTTMQVALALHGRESIAIMTNSLSIAQALSREPGIRVTCTGGDVHGDYYTLTGPVTERALSAQYYDLTVIGVSGISLERGLSVNSLANAVSMGVMLRNASTCIVVADHTKFGQVSYAFLADLHAVNVIVTDTPPPTAYRQHLEAIGTTLVIAGSG